MLRSAGNHQDANAGPHTSILGTMSSTAAMTDLQNYKRSEVPW